MTKKSKKQLWKLIFLLGPFLLIAGLTAGLISETWGAIPLALMIIGLVITGIWLVWQSQTNRWWKQRSTQAGTNALVATLAVFVILGLINFLGTRYHLRLDLTENQLFTLAPQSQELVRNLPQNVKVWLFTKNQNPQDRDLLDNFRRQNNKFQFEYIDPQARPGLADKFGFQDDGEVYLEFGDKKELVQTVNENERLSEVRLTNRLQKVLSGKIAKIYFVQGHGEHPITPAKGAISQAIQALTDKNFTTSALNLAEQPKVPEDASAVVVAGPQQELFASEVKALQDYLKGGGNVLLMINPNTDPKIDSLLQEWGVRLDNRLAIDTSGESVQLGPAAPLVTEYGQHPITKKFGNGFSFYPLSRPLEITPVPGVESTPLLKTKPYPSSWAESDQKSEKLEFNEGKDLKGPLTLGVALTRKLTDQTTPTTSPSPTTTSSPSPSPTTAPTPTTSPSPTATSSPLPSPSPSPTTAPTPTTSPSPTATSSPLPSPTTAPTPTTSPSPLASPTPTTSPTTANNPENTKESRLVVFGNSEFARDGLFEQQLNGDVFLNSVAWVSQQDQQTLSIRPKQPNNRRITLSSLQANLLTLLSLLLLPLIGLATGAIIWWKRR
ncbi:hypothetical protein B6N60_02042 [Richelia sinica FACHB-800]|uniref:ABC transporter n=1 Tax=Richelia sinica FACHB-800 TaxID=1357546 RepID=A0A975Y4N4_9NOST|nr:Gldg family protein [Richelia sinica]MBD2665968.1 Gldg family protein [Richelia sinica FACHB-800]QXE23352.1 hypothetical protein B6N60_02042 [Richelia sinica FACHB-800]